MTMINLLPWRDAQRRHNNVIFIMVLTVSLLLGVLGTFMAWCYVDQVLTNQHAANDSITKRNSALSVDLAVIKELMRRRDDIVLQTAAIETLQHQRSIPVRVWDDVARAIPNEMYLKGMKGEQAVLTLIGRAESPNVVARLVRGLDASDWLEETKVKFIKQNKQTERADRSEFINRQDNKMSVENRYIDFVVISQMQQTKETKMALPSALDKRDGVDGIDRIDGMENK